VKIDFHADPNPMKAGEDNQFHVTLSDAAGKPIKRCARYGHAHHARDAFDGNAGDEEFLRAGVEGRQQMYVGKGQAPMAGTWTVLVEARKNGNVIASMRTHLSASRRRHDQPHP
jgi:hypothetical protein